MKRGDIVWYEFQKPNKTRPVLIITRDAAIPELNAVTVIPITTVIRNLPTEVFLSTGDGMPEDCVANVDGIQNVSKHLLFGHITQLSDEHLDQVLPAIRFAFGFED